MVRSRLIRRGLVAGVTWQLPVLMYHSISHASARTALPGSVSRDRFEEQVVALSEAGWELVGLTEALSTLDREPARHVVALTFDDGLLDFLNAIDVLHRLDARATLYVPTAEVGWRSLRRERGASRLGWAELQELVASGMEVGSHTCSHLTLDVHPAATVRTEVRDSKRALEDQLGTAVTSFCYPHGYTSSLVRSVVAEAGYDNACVIGRRIARSTDDRFAIPRVEARPQTTGPGVRELVGTGERGLLPIAKRAATPAWRLARRTAFTVLHRELT